MATLLEKLGPEKVKVLEKDGEQYPTLVKAIMRELEENCAYISLSYETICYLKELYNLPDYSPVSIDKLFYSK